MTSTTKIALIDGPLPEDFEALGVRELFCDPYNNVSKTPASRHACQMANAILRNEPDAQIDNYVVFPELLCTSISSICDALDRASRSDATLIHCSFGIARNEPRLARAVSAILSSGRAIVASAPARGGPVYPAAYRGVTAVQGDARCRPQDWSWLNLPHADFGACPMGCDPQIAGASTAAAHFTGLYARQIRLGRDQGMAHLATYRGRERILAGGAQ